MTKAKNSINEDNRTDRKSKRADIGNYKEFCSNYSCYNNQYYSFIEGFEQILRYPALYLPRTGDNPGQKPLD